MEAATSAPDLSLHISLPSSNDASPSSAPGLGAGMGGRGAAAGGDPWRRLNGSTASTDLLLSPPPSRQEGAAGALPPWQLRPTTAANSPSSSSADAAAFLPVTVPRMTLAAAAEAAAARARPINGVPVYGRDSTFLGDAGDYRQRHAKVGLYSPYPSSAWPSSSLRSTTALAPVDATYLSPSSYHRMMSGTGRLHLHGALADTLRGYGGAGRRQHHFGSGLASSRYIPLLPASGCGMRAPRMRWTNTLHTRFVHAVELLGGHERESPPQLHFS
jgi:hypothetical protein